MPAPAPRPSRSSFITVPGMPAADLGELESALRALGSEVDTREEFPGPQANFWVFLPPVIHWIVTHITWAEIAKATAEGFFMESGKQIYEGLQKALKGAKKRDYRFRTAAEQKENAGGKPAPLLTLEIEVAQPVHATKVKFIFPADLPEENWPAAIKSLLSTSAPGALADARHPPHVGEDGILLDENDEEYTAPDYVFIPGRGWVNAYAALDELIRQGKA
jgi:hypothetical protein